VDRFVAELTATIEQPENRTKLTETFLLDLKITGRSEFRTYFAERLAKWGQVIREHNLGHAN